MTMLLLFDCDCVCGGIVKFNVLHKNHINVYRYVIIE